MKKTEADVSTARLTVNGHELRMGKGLGTIPRSATLAHVLRENPGLTGMSLDH